jgi:hypothetical protein
LSRIQRVLALVFLQKKKSMYHLLLVHSILRWLVLGSILLVIFLAWEGKVFKKPYTRAHRTSAAVASGLSHVQLLLGFGLYMISPNVKAYWEFKPSQWSEQTFFALVHFGLMTLAIIIITIGAALSKREADEQKRFRILFNSFVLALVIIFVAIPWPFSPLAQRPVFRAF